MGGESENVEGMFAAMRAEMKTWRAAHPKATLDEIAAQVTPRRKELMGAWLDELALQHGNGYECMGLRCERCGETMIYKGTPEREVLLLEGDMELARAYYRCPRCERGLFPPGSPTEAGASQLDT
jgi:DNA-directed RNA polymerase subunit RPC12/RpoP